MNDSFSSWAGSRLLKNLVLAGIAFAVLALGAYTYFTLKQARYIYSGPTTISVRGVGEATRIPDIATFSFGVEAQAEEPSAAQSQSAESLNAIVAFLEEQGIEKSDIKTTAYNLYPRYEYLQAACSGGFCPSGRQELAGYVASQTVEVKVRDTAAAGALIAGAGERGATNVSGVQFTVDDETEAKAEARAQAIEKARAQAKELAKALDARIVRLVGFWEEEGSYPMYERAYGGAMMDEAASVAPSLPTGENTVTATVNLTYEIR